MKIKLIIAIFTLANVHAYAQKYELWYRQPAQKWVEALPVGNGRLGAMVFGGIERERLQINEETLWTGEPRDYTRPGAAQWLDSIRHLLTGGQQKAAEQLAEEHFMGMKSVEGAKDQWTKDMLALKGANGNPALGDFDDSHWATMQQPSYDGWEAVGHEGLDGAVWLRFQFDVPPALVSRELVLDLNRIRDRDETFLNGQLIGSTLNADGRKYTIPAGILKPGKNTLSILVLNYNDKGGITGYKDTTRRIGLYDAASVLQLPLDGRWKYFVQNEEPPAVPKYQADYQPFCDLWLDFEHHQLANGYRRSLDLNTGTVHSSYNIDGVNFERTIFASQPDQLIAVRLTTSKSGALSFHASLTSPHKKYVIRRISNGAVAITFQVRHGALHGEGRLEVRTRGGKLTADSSGISITGADAAELYFFGATNYRNYKDVSADPAALNTKAAASIKDRSYDAIHARHLQEYQGWYNRFSVVLGGTEQDTVPTDERIRNFPRTNDPSFVALYLQYARYLLISSSRPGTRPANLQGIWNDLLSPPWGSKYTTNINAEMNYWPAEMLNLSALHEPLLQMISELSETGARTARVHYNMPGWVLHHNTDLWRGTAPINAANHGIWVTGGAWLCQHIWEHYLYTQDIEFLRKAYPILKGSAQFFNAFLTKDAATGWLISTPSNSPEQGGLVAGPSMDHQIIRSLFKNTIAAAALLKTDQRFSDSLKLKLPLIAPDQVGRHGQLQEWLTDKDDPKNHHRHVSHLWGVYPGKEISFAETPELMKAAQQSLEYRGDSATGWSLGWKINLWARFLNGDRAFSLVKMLMGPTAGSGGSYPNLFDAHPPFQIDGNFGGAAGIGEMILQSHNEFISILPALPAALPEGRVQGLRARGGFEFALEWKNGRLNKCTVTSLVGGRLNLQYGGAKASMNTVRGAKYVFDAKLNPLK